MTATEIVAAVLAFDGGHRWEEGNYAPTCCSCGWRPSPRLAWHEEWNEWCAHVAAVIVTALGDLLASGGAPGPVVTRG